MTANILVSPPHHPFTLPNKFGAAFNGYIYCGLVDKDPLVTENQVQIFLVNEAGDQVPVQQPIRTNAGGFLVYNGNPARFVTHTNHSLLVQDSYRGRVWYEPDMSVIDPQTAITILGPQCREALRRSYAEAGYTLVAGSFEQGGVVTTSTDVLLLESSGVAYYWTGSFPQTVAPSSSPQQGWQSVAATTLRNSLSASSGSALVGYKSRTVESELEYRALEQVGFEQFSPATMPERSKSSALWANGKKGVAVLGDSISHGAFAGNLFTNGWTRLLARSVNGQLGASSYGFTPMMTIGQGQNQSLDLHSISFTNTGSGWQAREAANGSAYLSGLAFRSVSAGNKIGVTVPSFQRRILVHHANQVGGGTFTIKVNGAIKATVNTSVDTNTFAATEVAMDDNGYGWVNVEMETTSDSPVDLCGFSYLSSVSEPCTNNFSQSGRRAVNLSTAVIDEVISKSSIVVFALGYNDSGETDASYISTVTSKIEYAIAAANRLGTKIVVPDFCWTQPSSNWMRKLLLRLATETDGVYVDFPSIFAYPNGSPADSARLVTDLNMFVDAAHPNSAGNALIFERVASAMGLSCSTKSEALGNHDYWVSLPLKRGSGLKNRLPDLASSVKRTANGLVCRLYLTSESGGTNPVGAYDISDAFNPRTDVTGTQGAVVPLSMLNGTRFMGAVSVSVPGATRIIVAGTDPVPSDIFTTFVMA